MVKQKYLILVSVVILLLVNSMYAQNAKKSQPLYRTVKMDDVVNESEVKTEREGKTVERKPLTAKEPSMAMALTRLAKAGGLNIIFDQSGASVVNSTAPDVDLNGVPPLEAMDIIFKAHDLAYSQLDDRTIIVFYNHLGIIAHYYLSLEEIVSNAEKYKRLNIDSRKLKSFPAKLYAFKDASIKSIIESLGQQVGVNIIFEDTIAKLVETKKVDFQLTGVSVPRALTIFFAAQKLIYNQVDRRTIMIAPAALANTRPALSLEGIISKAEAEEQLAGQ